MSVDVQRLPAGGVTVGRRLEHGYGVVTARVRFDADEWAEHLAAVKRGDYDIEEDQ